MTNRNAVPPHSEGLARRRRANPGHHRHVQRKPHTRFCPARILTLAYDGNILSGIFNGARPS